MAESTAEVVSIDSEKERYLFSPTRVKEFLKASGFRASQDFLEELNKHIKFSVLQTACERCSGNSRKTLMPYDL